MSRQNVLVFGASYGSLLASRLLLAGHDATLICLASEAELINREGTRVRLPVRGRSELVELDSRQLPGRLSAAPPEAVDAAEYDLVVLAMQEPQYGAAGVRQLLEGVARAGRPCMSIMNMPPLPYLARVPGVDVDACRGCYTAPEVWDAFDPALMTLCSPDPQAFRPPDEPDNVLQVRLPTNFKAARFASEEHTVILRGLQSDIDDSRLSSDEGPLELPVKLRVHDSVFVPLAKWSMLIAGNYRCVQEDGMRSIRDAVHSDLDASRAMYEHVAAICRALGAADGDLVPFEKYAAAAEGLQSPSSAARALFGGARNIERVDRLVQAVGNGIGLGSNDVDAIVERVDARLDANRAVTAASA